MSAHLAATRIALLTSLVVALASNPLQAQTSGLDILLTNAEGFDASGITALRRALSAAGHRVTVIAPLDDRRGSSMSHTTSGTLDYYLQDDGVWAVDGTPADAVILGLVHLFADDPPDLVVAGAGDGQNVGANILHSGTVGAALTASRAGIPALAFSVAVDGTGPEASARAAEALDPAAAFLVDLVRRLEETGGQGLLPARTALNVNYPAVGAAPVTGVRFATVSALRAFRQLFTVAGDTGPARVETTLGDAARAEEGSDLALLASGHVTLSVLDGSWDAGPASWEPLRRRLVIER